MCVCFSGECRHGVRDQLSVLHMSVQEAVAHFSQEAVKFDCVVSNPPYLTPAQLAVLQPEIAK